MHPGLAHPKIILYERALVHQRIDLLNSPSFSLFRETDTRWQRFECRNMCQPGGHRLSFTGGGKKSVTVQRMFSAIFIAVSLFLIEKENAMERRERE